MASRTARRASSQRPVAAPADLEPASAYSPTLDRAIYAVALLGILVVTHLAVQWAGGFEGGCLGFSDEIVESGTSGCAAASQSAYATFPGTPIPNTVMGFWFYGFVVALGLGIAAAKGQWLAPLKQVRLILVIAGAIYALYLMYRLFFSLESLCGLCLASHTLTFALTGLVVADTRRARSTSLDSTAPDA